MARHIPFSRAAALQAAAMQDLGDLVAHYADPMMGYSREAVAALFDVIKDCQSGKRHARQVLAAAKAVQRSLAH